MENSSAASQIMQVHCNNCGRDTKHSVLAEHLQEDSEPYDESIVIWWDTLFTLLECRGCEAVCLRKRHRFSEWNRGDEQVEFFPPPVSRKIPRWLDRLPIDERETLIEVYRALTADSRRLAVMGARTIVDLFIVRKVGDVGSFAEKLERLQTEGYLSSRNREVLDAVLDAGNASAHRAYQPSADHLAGVMDIVENLLHADLLQEEAAELRKNTPPRRSVP